MIWLRGSSLDRQRDATSQNFLHMVLAASLTFYLLPGRKVTGLSSLAVEAEREDFDPLCIS
jgi:hypothetical protein